MLHWQKVNRQSMANLGESYFIRSPALGVNFKHVLTREEFNSLKNAQLFLSDYTYCEQNVLQVLFASEEFESFLLNAALNHYYFPTQQYDFLEDTRIRSNLKVLGFLNSITSLRDQFPKFKSALNVGVSDKFKRLWFSQKDASIPFNFCERFRNYAQHQTQPVYSIMVGGKWDQRRELLEGAVSIWANVDDVCANSKIKLEEKQKYKTEFGKECDISLVFRETVGCIGTIFTAIRKDLEKSLNEAIDCYDRFLKLIPPLDSLSIGEVIHLSSGSLIDEFPIFDDFLIRVRRLRQTLLMTNNQAHFVSNRARGHR